MRGVSYVTMSYRYKQSHYNMNPYTWKDGLYTQNGAQSGN